MVKKTVSIRFSLLAYFLMVVSLVAVALISVEYHFSNKLAESAAENRFKLIAENLRTYVAQRKSASNLALTLLGSQHQLVSDDLAQPQNNARNMLISVLQRGKSIYSVYMGRQNGDFYQIINLSAAPQLMEKYQLDSNSQWLEVKVSGYGDQRSKTLQPLNLHGLHSAPMITEPSSYQPNTRPWYLKAYQNHEMIQTDPYWFSGINSSGITLAKRASDNTSVYGIDLTMQGYNRFLRAQKDDYIEEIFLFDNFGMKFASSSDINIDQTSSSPVVETSPLLTEEERAYIADNPLISVSNETDWPPYDYADLGQPAGYSVELMQLLAAKAGLRISFINGFTWDELMDLFKLGRVDVLQSAFYQPEREQLGLFTEPMYGIKNYLIVNQRSSIDSLDKMRNKTLGVIAGWSTQDFIRKNHPEIAMRTYESTVEAYFALNKGDIDGLIDTDLAMHYYARNFKLKRLKKTQRMLDFDGNKAKGLHMLVQKDKAILHSILNKTLASLTAQELKPLEDKWLNPSDTHQAKENQIPSAMLVNALSGDEYLFTLPQDSNDNKPQLFAFSSPLHDDKSGPKIGLFAQVEVMKRPYMEQVKISLYMAIGVLILAFFLVMLVTSRILRPINMLMQENAKVSKRQYSHVKLIDSHITEFHNLSQSLIDMSGSIQAYEKTQEELMESLIQLIADAIDAKSPYTGGHCNRVPHIALELADVASKMDTGPFAHFSMEDEEDKREFRIGAWLHDCGKVITPEHVVDKATKLETIYNRIHEIRTRFEVLWRDAEIHALKRRLDGEDRASVEAWLKQQQQQLQSDFNFIAETNIGGEFMSDEKQARVHEIAEYRWQRQFSKLIGLSSDEERRLPAADREESLPVEEKLLDDKLEHIVPREDFDHESYQQQGFKTPVPDNLFNKGEIYNLCIARGTLTAEERYKINEHVIMTIRMLEKLPLPENLSRVPEYAGTHHETLTGSGYPRQLSKKDLSIPARIMALADVFEALTASDRPYKKGKKLSEALKILGFMVKDEHIDKDVFELFLRSGVYLDYCKLYLEPKQIDDVNIEDYL